ncbi:hypothetical protein P20480_3473 [Pseudoalteromonas sp. BSi20480]|nr:hypothetical protein P20480_3473 [Pseudoalteromonas sp. BSi20480]
MPNIAQTFVLIPFALLLDGYGLYYKLARVFFITLNLVCPK